MKAKAILAFDRVMLSKRYIIETVNVQLKNISQVEHSRHRSETGFMLMWFQAPWLISLKKKPRSKLSANEFGLIAFYKNYLLKQDSDYNKVVK